MNKDIDNERQGVTGRPGLMRNFPEVGHTRTLSVLRWGVEHSFSSRRWMGGQAATL